MVNFLGGILFWRNLQEFLKFFFCLALSFLTNFTGGDIKSKFPG